MKNSRQYGLTGPFALLVVISAFFFSGWTLSSQAQPQKSELIGFIRLSVTETGATLVSATSTPGHLKKLRGAAPPSRFTYDVLSPDGDIIWTGSFDDPLRERMEYVDNDGKLRTRMVEHDRADVLIRIPVSASLHTIHLYRVSGAARSRSPFAILQVEF